MWNYSKISKNLKTNGYYEFNNYLSKIEIKKVQNTLLQTLNYIKPSNQKNLQKKYYEVKKFNNKLKGNWYDICKYNIDLLQMLHKKEMISLVKKFFNTKVVFSGRPAIHVHDVANDRILDAHQETNQFARDFLFIWAPVFDANIDQGSIVVYDKSHKNAYYKHTPNNKLGSSHIEKNIYKKFNKRILNVKSGEALLLHSAVIHGTWETKKKGFVKYILCDRYNPLKNIPYLKDSKFKTKKIPHFGIDYNSIND